MNTRPAACDQFPSDDVVRRYQAHGLSPSEAAAFEDHFLTCARCQHLLQRAPSRPNQARTFGLWTAGLAAAALVAGLLLRPGQDFGPLGQVNAAPVYLGAEIRSSQSALDEFDRAMLLYNARNYEAAARQLAVALDAGAPAPPTAFFLGAALLLDAKPKAAAAAFTRVIASGANPYRDEAHFFRAKAFLQLGDARAARRDLEAVTAQHPLKPEAAAIVRRLDH